MITREFLAVVKRAGGEDVDIPITCTLSYDAGTDPFAVQAIFEVGEGEDRVWHFSRELLEKGSRSVAPFGEGDVKLRYLPIHGMVMVCLKSPEGHADVALPAAEVREFLEDTHKIARSVTQRECDSLIDEFLREVLGG